MESFEIISTSIETGINQNKYKTLSSFIYNRNSHDKTMYSEVSEINFIVGVSSILNNDKDKKYLYELVNSNLNLLFNNDLVEKIKTLNKEDLKRICNYNSDRDSFSGFEYYLIRHLKDSDLEELQRDLIYENIDRIIKLSVSKNNLIVKVFPTKSKSSNNKVSYVVSLFYLVLYHLYKHLNKEENIQEIIKTISYRVQPIITKVVYTVVTTADDNYSWFKQLQELKPGYAFLIKPKDNNQVKFTFRAKEEFLASTLKFPIKNQAPSDTNNEERFISCTYKLEKNNTLKCKTTIISKDMVDCVFATLIDEVDGVVSMYSALSDDECLYLANYSILHRILSFTQQHEELRARLRLKVAELVQKGKLDVITDIPFNDKVSSYTSKYTLKQVFKDTKINRDNDKLLSATLKELDKSGIKNDQVSYSIVIMELLDCDNKVINKTLDLLDERTSEKIKKIISKLKRRNFNYDYSLNEFYKGF